MKKSTKIIALVLALAVILAGLAVAIFADGGSEEKIPGEYTKIPGSFDPTDAKWEGKYDGMTYGLWSSSRAFEAGFEPDYWYTGDLTAANIGTTDSNGKTYSQTYTDAGYIPSYVYVFADINTESAQIPTGQQQALTIDLMGHTLTMNGFKVGGQSTSVPNASVTVLNGKMVYTNGQMQVRGDSSFILENVHFVFSSSNGQGSFFYWSQGEYLRFTDCLLEMQKAVPFYLSTQNITAGDKFNTVIFENTDLVYPEGAEVANLFEFKDDAQYSNWDAKYQINFDKDSSISGNIKNWFRVLEAGYINSGSLNTEVFRQTVNFEPGFTFGDGLSVPTTYVFSEVDKTNTSAVTVKPEVTLPTGEDAWVYVTENAAPVEEVETVGIYTAPAGAWDPLSSENAGKYPGITFATWASEEDFLDGDDPIAWYQDLDKTAANYTLTFTADNITAAGVGYVHCFTDVANNGSSQMVLPNGVRLVINLGGHTLNDARSWKINTTSGAHPYSMFVVKNGKLVRSGAYTQENYCREDGTIVFSNLIFDYTAWNYSNLFNDCGVELMVFENSKLLLNEKNQFILQGNRSAPLQNYLVFKNTDVIQNGNPTAALFRIEQGYGSQNWTIVFDKDSSLRRSNNNLIALSNSSIASFSYTQGLYFELGCQVSAEAMPTYGMSYSYDGNPTPSNSDGKFLEIAVIPPVDGGIKYTLPTTSAVPTISGMNAPIGRTAGAFSTSAFSAKVAEGKYLGEIEWKLEDNAGTALKTIALVKAWEPTEGTVYAVWNTETDYFRGEEPVVRGTSDVILPEHFASAGYVVVYADVKSEGEILVGNTQSLLINLNGKKLTSTGNITVGDMAQSNPTASLTVKGGTLVQNGGQVKLSMDSSLTVDGVQWTVNTDKADFIVAHADNVSFKATTFDICTPAYFVLSAQKSTAGAAISSLTFVGTNIVYQSEVSAERLFVVVETEGSETSAEWNIILDASSSIKGNVASILSYYEGCSYSNGNVTVTESVQQKVTFEKGFKFLDGVTAPSQFTYYAVDVDATKAQSDAASALTVVYLAPATKEAVPGATFDITFYVEDEEAENVGKYTAPIGSWDPLSAENAGKYDGIAYATWATEADFLAGNVAPIAWYKADQTFAADNIGAAGVGYVHCFSDVRNESNSRLSVPNDSRIIINLGGHTLTDISGWNLSASGSNPRSLFMVMNGTILRPSNSKNTTYCRQDGTVIFKNVIYDASEYATGAIFIDLGCELFIFEDSIVRLNAKSSFTTSGNSTTPYQQYILFLNTDFEQLGDPTGALFVIGQTPYGKQSCTIVFDRYSSVKRNSNNWFSLNTKYQESTYTNFSYTQGLYFEAGCRISPEAMPTYNMSYSFADATGTHTYYANTDGRYVEVAVIQPVEGGIQYTLPTADAIPTISGMNAPIGRTAGAYSNVEFMSKVKAELYCSAVGFELKYLIGSSLYEIKALPVWKPTGDITYAIWENEQKYLEGVAPIYSGTGSELSALILGVNANGEFSSELGGKIPGYVEIYDNLVLEGIALVIGDNQSIIIDLAGTTLLVNSDIKIGYSQENSASSLKMMGGTLELSDGTVVSSKDSETVFANLNIKVKGNKFNSALSAAAGNVLYSECTIMLEGVNAGFDLAGGNVSFVSTSIEQSGAAAPLFWVGTENTASTVKFDKASVIVRDSNVYAGIKASLNAATLKLYFEEEFAVSKDAVPDFTYLSSVAPTAAGTYVHTGASGSVCDIAVVTSDMSKYTDIYFVTVGDKIKLLSTIENYAAAEIDPDNPKNFFQVWESVIDMGSNKTPFTKRNGAIIKLFRDTEIKLGGTYSDYDLTFDLNGYKLYSNTSTSIQLGIDQSATWYNGRVIKFISSVGKGKLVLTGSSSPLQARPGTNVYFENLEIEVLSHLFNDGGAELVHFKNCTIYKSAQSTGKPIIISRDGIGGNAQNYNRYLVLDGTELRGVALTSIWSSVIDYAEYRIVVMNGSILDNANTLVNVGDNMRDGVVLPDEVIVRNVYIDVNTKFTKGTTNFAYYAPINAVGHHRFDFKYVDGITDYKEPGKPISENDLLMLGEGEYFKISDQNTLDISSVAYAYAFPGCVKVAVLKGEGASVITLDSIKALAEGTTVTFYTDILYKATETDASVKHKDGLIFDLAGYTLTLEDTLTVYGTAFTVKNGTVTAADAFSGTLIVLGDNSLTLTLDGVKIEEETALDAVFAVGGAKLVLKNTEISVPATAVVTLADGAVVELNNVKVDGAQCFADLALGENGAKINMYSSTVNVSGAFLKGTTESGIADVKLTGAAVLASEFVSSSDRIANIFISESMFSFEPVLDSAVGTVTLAKSERAMEVENLAPFTWRVTVFNVRVKASIFIESDFGIKFYLPIDTNITKIVIAGREYVVADITDTEEYDGKMYKFILLENISPDEAAEVIDITLTFVKDEITLVEDTGYCVLDYFKTLLNSDKTLKLKQLGCATIDYIAASYSHEGKSNSELDALIASAQYALYRADDFVAESGEDNTAAIAGAISGAQFELSSMVRFRFNLNPAYTGIVKINGREFTVENGVCDGETYIAISLPAFEICRELTIEADGAVGSYSLEKYAAAIENMSVSEDDKALVRAFYNYCRYAEVYRALYEY